MPRMPFAAWLLAPMEKNRLKNGAYDFIILANRWLWTLPANKPSIAPECRLEYSDQVWRHQTLMTCGGLSKWLRSSVDQDPLTHVWSLTLIRVSIEIILFALTNHLEVNLTNLISHLESFWTSVFFFFFFKRSFTHSDSLPQFHWGLNPSENQSSTKPLYTIDFASG